MDRKKQESQDLPEHYSRLLEPLAKEPKLRHAQGTLVQDLHEMNRRLRCAEASYGEAYSQVSAVETALSDAQNTWNNENLAPASSTDDN